MAGANPQQLTGLSQEDWAAKREQLERQADGLARKLTIPDEDFQVPVTEALWFSNNPWVEQDLFSGAGDRLIGYLKAIPEDPKVVQAATRSILSREPTDEEQQALVEYLAGRAERRESAIKQLVWALVSTPEFRFNH